MIIAVDLGGTKIEIACVENSVIRDYKKLATSSDFKDQVKDLVKGYVERHPSALAVAMGVPGPVKHAVMQGSRPLDYEKNVDFGELLSEVNIPLLVQNDLYMAAHEELHNGVGKSVDNFCLVALSTGIGVAVARERKILTARTEMGHLIMGNSVGPSMSCIGHANCWASMASGSAIERRFADKDCNTTSLIFEKKLTHEQLVSIRNINARGIGALINAYDPDVVSIMGSLGLSQFDKIIPDSAEIEPFTINRPIPPIVRTCCQGSIGISGAYHAAMNKFFAPQ